MTTPELFAEALAHRAAGKLAEAEIQLRAVLSLAPSEWEAYQELGSLLATQGRYEEAEGPLARAVALNPRDGPSRALYGGLLGCLGRHPEAIRQLNHALQLAPDMPAAHWNRAGSLLVTGEWLRGWDDYRWGRVNLERKPRTLRPEWNGGPMPGRTLWVWAEQGIGDTLCFLRLLKWARERSMCGRLIFEVQEPLTALLTGQTAADEVFAQHADRSVPLAWDEHVSLLTLPYLMGLTPADVPAEVPYIRASGKAPLQGPPSFRVGLCWAGNAGFQNDKRRSMAPELLAPLLDLPGVTFYSLQMEQEAPVGIVDLAAGIRDWMHTAALLNELDLIISVDTAVAHLAGAMGRPVWILLPYAPDFRWLLAREDTAWYPTARLFRQPRAHDWDTVIERVRVELSGRGAAEADAVSGLPGNGRADPEPGEQEALAAPLRADRLAAAAGHR